MMKVSQSTSLVSALQDFADCCFSFKSCCLGFTAKLASSSTATGATATPVRGDSRGEMPKSASRSDKGEPSDGSKSKKARKTSTREDDDIKLDAAERFMLRFVCTVLRMAYDFMIGFV
jgi:hypothetical protein